MILPALLGLQLAAGPRPCAHQVDEPRPRVTIDEQAESRRVIRAGVELVGGSDDLRRLMLLVAERESSLQAGVVHRLPQDVAAAGAAWAQARSYHEAADNPHAGDAERWQTYGLFGLNSAYYLRVWDPAADPRLLCDAAVSVLTYRRAAERLWRKLSRAACRKGQVVTWAVLHTAIARGKLCAEPSADFRRRALRRGLDPDGRVTDADLGRDPPDLAAAATKIRLGQ